MWHYVLHGANHNMRKSGKTSAASNFISESLNGAGLNRLAIREPYFHSKEQADQGLYDGAEVDLEFATRMILAATMDDESMPWCQFEGTGGQYVNIGLDGEVYLGLSTRQETAEGAARRHGFFIDISSTQSPYLSLPGNSIDPVLDKKAWLHIFKRAEREPVFALERWANGPYGELGHMLREHGDVARMADFMHPRAGLALFSAQMLVPVDEARTALLGPEANQAGAGPDLHLVYQTAAQQPLNAVGFQSLRELDSLLDAVSEASKPRVLAAPAFVAWHPPTVETYVCPDADGVVRSSLGYHVDEPDD
ncbi:hypothetical protein [Streptomyces sp. BE133]|uniref:hypothetical protein n=1 Tax=Streptomyces sp. BE133 TaxID=3002523 RepID=UPI002E780906|nr:hypothetical protein [Streptomyces sp. BE133]MEE1812229.1 hypothetical protein [Streptomyces sp. BE133]